MNESGTVNVVGSASSLMQPAPALDFPRADGPTRPQVSLPAGAGAGATAPAPLGGDGGRRRAFSVTTLLAMVMVLLTGWAIGVSYYFNYAGLKRLLETEERDRAGRAARAIESAVQLDIVNLDAVVESLHDEAELARALAAPEHNPQRLMAYARRVLDPATVDAVTLLDRQGRRVMYSGSPLMSDAGPAAGAPIASATRGIARIEFVPYNDLLSLRVAVPVQQAGATVGTLLVERLIHGNYLRDVALATDVEIGIGDAQRVFASTLPSFALQGTLEDRQRVLASLAAEFTARDGPHDVLTYPLAVLDQPLLLTVLVPKGTQRPALVQGRQQLALVAALTLLAALLLGVVLTRYLIQPIRRLTERAEELALRYAGRALKRRGNEFDSLVASFDAMTDALLGHSDRLRQAHLNELQNSLELQRQYALMRLLRGLATAANESDSVEQALQAALHEIGDYLDWPVGRIALMPDELDEQDEGAGTAARSLWFVRDEARFADFMKLSASGSLVKSVHGLIGRAWVSGMPHWISDVSNLAEWRRRDAAVAAGLHTAVVIPVTARGHVTAFIEFFADHRVEANAEMLELIEAVGIELSRVAERHLAQQQLRAREAEARRLALVAAHTEKGVILLDPFGRVQWVNDAFTRWTGHTAEEARGRLTHTLIRGPETDPAVVDKVARAIVQGQPVKFEVVAYNRSGERGEHEVEGRPLLDERGAYVQYALLATDITALKQTQAALHANETFFRALFENSPVPTALQDRAFRLVRVNHAFAELLGCKPADLEGQDPTSFTHPEDLEELRARRALVGPEQPPLSFVTERRLVRRDGTVVYGRVHGAGISGQKGETMFLSVVENITDIKTNEKMLRDAKDVAESASRAKSQFLANMSHEIRTPMNGVLGMTELLLGTPLSDKQRRFAEAVYRSGENLLAIINDILDFSKIEAGKLELESVDFDLRTLVEDVFELLAPRAFDKRLELAHRVADGVPQVVRGDPTRLRQVLSNLVGNAIKFTEEGEVVVTVSAQERSEPPAAVRPGDEQGGSAGPPVLAAPEKGGALLRADVGPICVVAFEVRDTGIGVRPQALDKLFTSFMQADQSMSRRYGGTGLGLAISKQLVELMGGTITASSHYGEGSTFRFEVPLPMGDGAAFTVAASPQNLTGRRVIVVEDNPTNRSILEGQLRRLGVEVATAEHGAQALELLTAAARAGEKFDLAVIDMKMPIMDGLTLASRLRRDPQLADMGLVLLTSLTGGVEARQAHESGVDVFLAKPVRGQELTQALASVLAGRANGARSGAPPRSFENVRVLLAEDNPVNQEVARVMLNDLGCRVGLAANGRQALAELSQVEYDLVLMDCQMPEMDGFEAVRRLRDSEQTEYSWRTPPAVPVVAMTANALAGDAERCLEAGFSDYLAKPFRQQQLTQLLARWTRRAPAAAQEAPHAHVPPAAGVAQCSVPDLGELPAQAASLDRTAIDRILDMERRGAPDLLARLISTYLSTAARLVEEAAQAAARQDAPGLRHAVHTLKSSSANLGATGLAQLCAELEAMVRSGRLPAACQQWPDVHAEYQRVVVALQALACHYATRFPEEHTIASK